MYSYYIVVTLLVINPIYVSDLALYIDFVCIITLVKIKFEQMMNLMKASCGLRIYSNLFIVIGVTYS